MASAHSIHAGRRGKFLCFPCLSLYRVIAGRMSGSNPADGAQIQQNLTNGESLQPDDISTQNQVVYGSDSSSLTLPQDSDVSSFPGILHPSASEPSRSLENESAGESRFTENEWDLLGRSPRDTDQLLFLNHLETQVNTLFDERLEHVWDCAGNIFLAGNATNVRAKGMVVYTTICVHYQDRHTEILKWLGKFGRPDTHTSNQLLVFAERPDPAKIEGQSTLLPLLATLLHEWHKVAEAARKSADQNRKKSRSSRDSASSAASQKQTALSEEQDLQKLFDYTLTYVKLQTDQFYKSQSAVLVESLVTICKAATSREHIENSLFIMEALCPRCSFSDDPAHSMLEVLCAIVAQLPQLKDHAYEVIVLLANEHPDQTLELLFRNFRQISDTEPRSIEIHVVQGAVTALNALYIESRLTYENERLNPNSLLLSCLTLSEKHHGKLDVAVLLLLAALIKKDGIPELGHAKWKDGATGVKDMVGALIETLQNCIGNVASIAGMLGNSNDEPSAHALVDNSQSDAVYAVLTRLVKNEKVVSPNDRKDPKWTMYNTADKLKAAVKVHNRIEKQYAGFSQEKEREFARYFLGLQDRICGLSSKLLVRIFLRSLVDDPHCATIAFGKMLSIVKNDQIPSQHRLNCLRLLFRIRCDSKDRISVLSQTESQYLAAALNRLEASNAEESDQTSVIKDTRLWMYPGPDGLPEPPPSHPSNKVFINNPDATENAVSTNDQTINMKLWLECVLFCLNAKDDWEVYSYIVVHLGAQLTNMRMFYDNKPGMDFLQRKTVEVIYNDSYMEPPLTSGLKKSNVAICVYDILTMLIPYHGLFAKGQQEQLVNCFARGLSRYEGTAKSCIHALSLCSLELPAAFDRFLGQILNDMQRIITQPSLSMHVLEFLGSFGRNNELRIHLQSDHIRSVFGICMAYLKIARESKAKNAEHHRLTQNSGQTQNASSRPISTPRAEDLAISENTDAAKDFPDYVFALTFHVMNFWFLSVKLQDRASHVKWLVRNLVFSDGDRQYIEEQSQVFIDMMQRTTFSDLGETFEMAPFEPFDGPVTSKSWLVGHSILTVQTAGRTGKTQIIKRQASGTTHATYQQHTATIPDHHTPMQIEVIPESQESTALYHHMSMLPSHILLQQISTAAGIMPFAQPIPLPTDARTERRLKFFDGNNTVDSHGVGLIYIGPKQVDEHDILSNTEASLDFNELLKSIGYRIPLDMPGLNTHGLISGSNGTHTYAWRDRVTEMVFHVPSMMPNDLEDDPQFNEKKRTIGNDFVKVFFDHSGLPFNFDTISSAFNYVNIVVTPVDMNLVPAETTDPFQDSPEDPTATQEACLARSFYKVQCLTNTAIPPISPASEPKIISGPNLALFVRQTALNANVFSLVWQHRNDDASQYVSRWRNRLQEIKRLRKQVVDEINARVDAAAAEDATTTTTSVFGSKLTRKTAGERTSLYPEDREAGAATVRPVVDLDAALASDNIIDILDFSKWSS